MHILITGGNGQLGTSLQKNFLSQYYLTILNRKNCDLAITSKLEIFLKKFTPDLIIHTAALTNVDGAELKPRIAEKINIDATAALAERALELDIPIIYISTDYVFDGNKKESYFEEDNTNPLSVYGKTKWLGEQVIRAITKKHLILRTSWLISEFNNNFLIRITKLAQTQNYLRVVHDNLGSPTSTSTIADFIHEFIQKNYYNSDDIFGTYHLTSSGEVSSYDYVKFILIEMQNLRIKINPDLILFPVSSKDFFLLGERPLNSRLNCQKVKNVFNAELPSWEDSVIENLLKLR